MRYGRATDGSPQLPRWRFALFVAVAVVVAGCAGGSVEVGGLAVPQCEERAPAPGHARRVERALRARQDVWGNELLHSRAGPTYEGVRRYLPSLLLARAPGDRPLTESGFHYLAFGRPAGPQGSGSVPLHVADGSQIVSRRWRGSKLTVWVGRGGRERYGSCRSRLAAPRLAGGYLPILKTGYVDASGARYRQESFVAPLEGSDALASFVRLSVDARGARAAATIRLSPTDEVHGTRLTYPVSPGARRTVHATWLNSDAPRRLRFLDRAAYDEARRGVRAYWERRLAQGAQVVVPERGVMDAMRNLLIQNLVLTWRYSVGNPYQELATADGVAAAGVIGAYGFPGVNREILRTSFRKRPTPFPNWKMGAKLAGTGLFYRLFRDRSFVTEATPLLSRYLDRLRPQIDVSPSGLLPRERFSQDVAEPVVGLHAQAVVWQGLRLMGAAWADTGHPALAATCRRLSARLGSALRRAIHVSERRLPDGSLFIPVRLLDDEPPYDALTASRAGSYWNLVMPYALASGLLEPGGREAAGVTRYLLLHGSRLLGLVRAGAYALYGDAPIPTSGTDQVYGLNTARFLADNDRPDQLVLSLYGHLGAGMAPGTFVSGEAASVAPLRGETVRTMFLPPNGTSNAAYLETLRLMLVHETTDRAGRPSGLQLAYATPRAWLAPGKRIAVRGLPTSFGPVSYSIEPGAEAIRVSVDVPGRAPLGTLHLRLRAPAGSLLTTVSLDGRPYARLARGAETISLPTRSRRLELVVDVERERSGRP